MKQYIRRISTQLPGIICAMSFLMTSAVYAQLSGTYTVGSSGDYNTLSDAVSALKSQGISGPVIFNIKDGTYNDQVDIDAITGASATNTITFQSQSGAANKVQIYHTATGVSDNYVIKISGANYLIFQNLTLSGTGASYSRVIEMATTSNHISILNDSLTSASAITSSDIAAIVFAGNAQLSNITISNNAFSGGGYGIRLIGIYNNLSSNLIVTNNRISNVYGGIVLQYVSGATISGNSASVQSGYAVYMDQMNGIIQVTKNQLMPTNAYGLYYTNVTGGTPPTGSHGLIANNMINMSTTSGYYGFYLVNSSNQDIVYNTVYISGSSTSSRAFYIGGSSSNTLIMNNIFANDASGYAYYVDNGGSIATSDYNDIYSTGNYLGYWGGNIRDLSALQTASNKEAHSVSVYPHFLSNSDLHVTSPWLNARGSVYSNVTTDIDGDTRDASHPDIGADEFTPAAGTTTPLSGAYTIGSGGDYSTVNDAVNDLMLKGVSTPVTFNIKSGTYIEQVSLRSIPGSSAADTVTFESQSGSASDVVLFFNANSNDNNYVWLFTAASHIRFMNLTLQSNNSTSSQYGIVLHMTGASGDLVLQNCIIIGSPVTSSSDNFAMIYSNGSIVHNFTLQDDSLSGGSNGARMIGVYNDVNTGISLINNRVKTSFYGFVLQYASAPIVMNNVVQVSSGYGIYMDSFSGSFEINANKLILTNAYGLYLTNGSGGAPPTGQHGQVVNNSLSLNMTGGYYGAELNSITNTDFVYNSVSIVGSATSSTAFRLDGNSSVQVTNNIFSNDAEGFAYTINATNGLVGSDYNNFYSSGNYIAYWSNANVRDLDALKTASGKDAHSMSIYPHFASSTDLHTDSPWLDGHGTTFTGLTTDITGATRDASHPDMGAYEFTSDPNNTPLSGTYGIGSGSDYPTFTSAINDLLLRGVSGPVTFDVLSGTYLENVSLRSIPGSSTTDTVTFRSKTGKSADVNVYYAANGAPDNYVMQLIGTNHLRIWNLSMLANNATNVSYGHVITFIGATGDIGIKHSTLVGSKTTSGSGELSVFYGNGSILSGLVLESDSVNGGSYGLWLTSLYNDLSEGLVVQNTYINSAYVGLYAQYQKAPQIIGNQINSVSNYALYIDNATEYFQFVGNKIVGQIYGAYFSNLTGGTPPIGTRGLIANNFFVANGQYAGRSVNMAYLTNVDFYFNSLLVTGNQTSSITLYLGGSGTDNQFVDNIYANKAAGYTYYVDAPALIKSSDYNDFYTSGTKLARWSGTDMATLADLKTANSMDAHSISASPGFISNTDLHATAAAVDSAGTPLSRVTTDIDGQTRDLNKPDIGADEFIFGATPIENPPVSDQPGTEIPKKYALFQNYPNPFNPTTQIRYGLPRASDVRIEVYNMLGQKVMTLLDGHQSAGYHIVTWKPGDAASGIYFYRLQAGSYVKIMKMLFVK